MNQLPEVDRILIDEMSIQQRIAELSADINAYYQGEPFTLVPVLKGSFIFAADLCRCFPGDQVAVDFIEISSYGSGRVTSGEVRLVRDLSHDVYEKHVLIVEDIVDTGLTLKYLRELLSVRQPKSLRVVSLLSKAEAKGLENPVDYVGFDIPDEFVVGYGLDLAEKYRNLRHVAVLKQP
ncbi:MAG: hypoxanthine phosphoribosyltransferase [Fimbriimonadaceae bacterium]